MMSNKIAKWIIRCKIKFAITYHITHFMIKLNQIQIVFFFLKNDRNSNFKILFEKNILLTKLVHTFQHAVSRNQFFLFSMCEFLFNKNNFEI